MQGAQGHVYYLHKERGDTSFQAIRKLQRAQGLKKVGHCGTLDRFAEGLLIVLSEHATKLAGAITGLDKSYVAEVEFGRETQTLDPEGQVLREAKVPSEELIHSTLGDWLAESAAAGDGQGRVLWQQPPAFSAIHSNGVRLYQKALAGEDLSGIPARKVMLYSCQILGWQAPILKLELRCSKGFYVRSFARDLAIRCGSVGHLHSLLRTSIGGIGLDRAQTLAQGVRAGDFVELLLELQGDLRLKVWQTGKDIYCDGMPAEDWRLLCQGRIPTEIFRTARAYFGGTSLHSEGLSEPKEFVLIDGAVVLGLFRYSLVPEGSDTLEPEGTRPTIRTDQAGGPRKLVPRLKFWHNFCRAQ